jgi:phosphate transport system protein
MRTGFHDQLDGLTALVADMCGLAGEAMAGATQALLQADLVLAENVITDHDRLARMKAEAEETAFVLLALQSPVAGDLRAEKGGCTLGAPASRLNGPASSPLVRRAAWTRSSIGLGGGSFDAV